MRNLVGPLRQSGSFVAGILIGISIVVATFAVADSGPGRWPTILAFSAPVILLIGMALQACISFRSRRHLRATPETSRAKRDDERSGSAAGLAEEGAAGPSLFARARPFALAHSDAGKCATTFAGHLR